MTEWAVTGSTDDTFWLTGNSCTAGQNFFVAYKLEGYIAATPTPTSTSTATPTPTNTSTPTPTNTSTPTPTPTPCPGGTTLVAGACATNTPTPTPTLTPTPTNTPTPTPTATSAPSGINSTVLGQPFNIWWNNPPGNDYFHSGIILPENQTVTITLAITNFSSPGAPGYGDQLQCGSYPIATTSIYTFAAAAWNVAGTFITPPGGCELYVITTIYSPGTSYQSGIAMWSSSLNPGSFSLHISGHGCVRAQPLDSGGTSCQNGDIVASRAVIGFSQNSAAEAGSFPCGHTSCGLTDDSGYYVYDYPSWPSGADLYWQFQGSGWCAGCGTAYFKWIPTGGYKILGISQSTISTGNDFIFDAQLYRGASAYSGTTTQGNIYLLAPGAVDAASGQSATLSSAVESAIQSAENALAAAHGATAEDTAIGFGRFITSGGVLKLAGGVGTVAYALFFNPETTGDAVLSFPDNGARITIAPQTTVIVTIDPVAEPQGVQEIAGTSVAVDTLVTTAANPTPATFPTPATLPTTTTTTGTGTGTGTGTTTAQPPGNTNCGDLVFTLWQGLGPLMECLFNPTTDATATLTDAQTQLATKIGFADVYYLIGVGGSPGWLNGTFPGLFSGSCWDFSMPFQIGTSVSNLTAEVCPTDPLPAVIRPVVTAGLLAFAILFTISMIKSLIGWTGGGESEEAKE